MNIKFRVDCSEIKGDGGEFKGMDMKLRRMVVTFKPFSSDIATLVFSHIVVKQKAGNGILTKTRPAL